MTIKITSRNALIHFVIRDTHRFSIAKIPVQRVKNSTKILVRNIQTKIRWRIGRKCYFKGHYKTLFLLCFVYESTQFPPKKQRDYNFIWLGSAVVSPLIPNIYDRVRCRWSGTQRCDFGFRFSYSYSRVAEIVWPVKVIWILYNFDLFKMGYHLISVEPLVNLTGLDGPVIRLLTGIFIGKLKD